MVAVEHCNPSIGMSARIWMDRVNSSKPFAWDIEVSECKLSLRVPGAKGEAVTASLVANEWRHLTVITEDTNFNPSKDLNFDPSQRNWKFRSRLIIDDAGEVGSIEGKVRAGTMLWESSRLCLTNDLPDSADFAQIYLFNRRLDDEEVTFIRQRSIVDRNEGH